MQILHSCFNTSRITFEIMFDKEKKGVSKTYYDTNRALGDGKNLLSLHEVHFALVSTE